ncbi:MAG TPA: acyl-CoA dehydrogenase family protein [Solirubrobacteraceae bacterium]|nr:acyl-CoA dehydrogenase family protein [Solirubrobacteraceae bacterium]
MSAPETVGPGLGMAPPEPDLTPDEMVARAVALRPELIADQEATEQRTYYSPQMHEAFLNAGFYHLYVPRRYGGYEFDVPTYVRVVQEIARGCVSTAWCAGLAMNHALMVGSWWPQEAQDEIFAGGDFRCSSVAAPVGKAAPTDGGWEINGQVAFASGTPYATFYMGQALLPPPADAGPEDMPPQLLFVAPRSEWKMLDDWGDMLGLKGSGSHSIRFEGTRIPGSWGFEGTMLDVEVGGGTPGSRLHGNPMYSGRAVSIFTLSLAAVTVGAAYNMLDEYERLMRERKTPLPPFIPRVKDPDYQRWYGRALTHIATAEAAVHKTAERHMELCRRNVEDGVPYTFGDDMLLAGIAREAMLMCWRVVDDDLWQTVGAGVARDGERTARVFRDMAVAAAHRNLQLRDLFYGDIGRAALGEPNRIPGR